MRGRVIAQVGRLVESNKEALAALVTREMGKPYAESLGEVQEIIDTCDFFLGEGRRLYGQTVPSEMPDKQLFTFRTPVGVAAIVTAANFPVAVPSWYLVPALLCGNAVVWKPSESTPAVAAALASLFWQGGIPRNVLHLVHADGPTTFDGLSDALEAQLVDKVGFTGSTTVGRRIGELAGRHLQSACLELGGKNPLVVAADADLELAVEGALFSGFGTAGQRCTSLGTAFVHESLYDEFVARLAAAVSSATVGDPTGDVLFGPLINENYLAAFEKCLDLVQPHHVVHGSTGTGRITADNPRAGFVGDPSRGRLRAPDGGFGSDGRRRALSGGDVRAPGRRRLMVHVRRSRLAGERAWLWAVGGDLHVRSGNGVPVPRTVLGRHGQRQQLDVGRRGAPAVRRKRLVRQRFSPVGHLGA